MPVYFMRHGESIANDLGVFAGQGFDAPLSPKGFEQARQAALIINDVNVRKIVSSPLLRALQTAHEVAVCLGLDSEDIEVDERIAEYDMGVLTKTEKRRLSPQELVSAEGAEHPELFKRRVLNFLQDVNTSHEVVLVVSHAGIGRMIEALRTNVAPAEFHGLPALENAIITQLDLDWLATA